MRKILLLALILVGCSCDKNTKEYDHMILSGYTDKTNCIRVGNPYGPQVVECLWVVGYRYNYYGFADMTAWQQQLDSDIQNSIIPMFPIGELYEDDTE